MGKLTAPQIDEYFTIHCPTGREFFSRTTA